MKPSLKDFVESLNNNASNPPLMSSVQFEHNIPIYDGHALRSLDESKLLSIKQEWADCLQNGAGVLTIKNFYENPQVVKEMSQVMLAILEKETREKDHSGDHFAKQGSNQRIWNVFEKSAVENPQIFIDYYSNFLFGAVSEAWLGPGFEMTAQVNLVPPNSTVAQAPHRDYHLGFQTNEEVNKFPLHAHKMSSMLTLQGAIAHIDMPIESGPTRFLPFSQQYSLGYLLYRSDDFKAYFEENAIQIPLALGDAVFFNPALMHGAGANSSKDIQRLANLLQISSPFGKAMEVIDYDRIQSSCFEFLTGASNTLDDSEWDTLMTIMSDSYPFPTNLDRDIPLDALTPTSNKALLMEAIEKGLNHNEYKEILADYHWRRSS